MIRIVRDESGFVFLLPVVTHGWHMAPFTGPVLFFVWWSNYLDSSLQAAAAAKGIADLQQTVMDDALADSEELGPLKEEEKELENADPEEASEEDARRKAALQKLESASEDSFLGQVCKH